MKQRTSLQKNLTESISDEIIETTIDLSIDYAEITMDEIIDGTLREIPLIKTIYSLGKLGYSIREKFFVKKILTFLQEFHSQKIDEFNSKNSKPNLILMKSIKIK